MGLINASFSRPNMVRTKGDGGAARTVASKVKLLNKDLLDFEYLMQAPRKALGGGGSSGAASRAIASSAGGGGVAGADVLHQSLKFWTWHFLFNSSDHATSGSPAGKYSGGNGYNPQPTPEWQKPLTSFFIAGWWNMKNYPLSTIGLHLRLDVPHLKFSLVFVTDEPTHISGYSGNSNTYCTSNILKII